ncbi:vWA domain-containing protein [uncultured Fibrobacter sp.]|uniref:vWA domain-containing protein n=1 Tax=uncultured Fibrobacter sp. TaxID=261512 RepID=UPI0025F975BB|nr:vWA domain-containing protein [uncultured Fibrobacter sp.]
MENTCFKIKALDKLQDNITSIKNANTDNRILKRVSEIEKAATTSDNKLKAKGEDLYETYSSALQLKEKGGDVDNIIYTFVIEILDGILQSSPSERYYLENNDAFLMELSKEIDLKREIPVDETPELEYSWSENLSTEETLEFLELMDKAIKDRDQLIKEYGDIIAFLNRLLTAKGEFDKRRQIKEDLPLFTFVRTCAKKKDDEIAAQIIEELKAESNSENTASDNAFADSNTEEPIQESVQEFVDSLTSETPVENTASEPTETATADAPETTEAPTEEHDSPTSAAFTESEGNRADVLFVLDASGSMRPCFDQLRTHIKRFVEPFKTAGFTSLRLGLLAYSANKDRTHNRIVYRNMFLCPNRASNMATLYGDHETASKMFFTNTSSIEGNVDKFVRRLDEIKCLGDEDTPFAMDCAADFPFEPINTTRRVIILFTDERIDDGVSKMKSVGENYSTLDKIMDKISKKHISLYFYGPSSPATEVLEDYPRVVYQDVIAYQDRHSPTETWDSLNIGRVLESLGKSISRSALSATEEPETERAIYHQDTWSEDSWN